MKIKKQSESYGEKKSKKISHLINLGWLSIFSSCVVLFFIYYFLQSGKGYWWLAAMAGSLVLIGYSFKNNDFNSLKFLKKSYQKGVDGEMIVLDKLSARFDDSYYYIKNYNDPLVCLGDIDGILVGPQGVFLLEIKNWHGSFRISGIDIYRHLSGYLFKLYKSPVRQLEKNTIRFSAYLNSNGIFCNVRPFIVLVSGQIEKFDKNIGIYITNPEEIADKILGSTNQNLSEEQIKKIQSLLKVN